MNNVPLLIEKSKHTKESVLQSSVPEVDTMYALADVKFAGGKSHILHTLTLTSAVV